MSSIAKNRIVEIVESIKPLQPRLEILASLALAQLRTKVPPLNDNDELDRWCKQIDFDSITRVRNLIENNFHAIETLALLSLARYMFELNVQLKQIDQDPKFALVYARRLYEQQVEFYSRLADQLKRESELYLQLGKTKASQEAIELAITQQTCLYQDELAKMHILQVAMVVDTQARAHAVEQARLNQQSLSEFNTRWGDKIKDLKYSLRKWSKKADSVGMQEDYAFIYSFTSRLMHATPVSITTEQQVLQDNEVLLFARYIRQQMNWFHDRVARKYTQSTVH